MGLRVGLGVSLGVEMTVGLAVGEGSSRRLVGDLMGLAGRGRAVDEGEGDLVGALAGSNKHQDQ